MKTKNIEVKDPHQIALDKACAKAMQGNDKAKAQAAFNQIWIRYKEPMLYFIMKYVKFNKEVAEDIRQEVFSKISENIDQYNYSTVLTTWMYKIAKNQCIDYLRQQRVEVLSIESLKSEFSGEDALSEITFQLEDKHADVVGGILKTEKAEIIMTAVVDGIKFKHDNITAKAKQAVTLIFLDEKPYQEVADQLSLPVGTVKTLVARAKEQMKNFLSKKSPTIYMSN